MKNSSNEIEQSNSNRYYSKKVRIQHVFTLKDLEDILVEDPTTTTPEISAWTKKDRKAQAIIGLSQSKDLLEKVRDVTSAKDMWTSIKNVFERHTLLNKLAARKKFYTASMSPGELVLQFSNRIRQLSATLKSMNVEISERETAMALLNGLPEEYSALISALDAIDEDESKLEF